MGDGKNSVTSGAALPATCRPAPVRRGPGMSRSPHALPAPEYRLVPRVGSIPTPRVVMPAGFPWRQGMLCGDGIASVKFSLPERLLITGTGESGVDTAAAPLVAVLLPVWNAAATLPAGVVYR